MTRRFVLVVGLALGIAVPVSAQLFGVVYDPTNYANAVLRLAELHLGRGCEDRTEDRETRTLRLALPQFQHRVRGNADFKVWWSDSA